jgi:hypothetical protein
VMAAIVAMGAMAAMAMMAAMASVLHSVDIWLCGNWTTCWQDTFRKSMGSSVSGVEYQFRLTSASWVHNRSNLESGSTGGTANETSTYRMVFGLAIRCGLVMDRWYFGDVSELMAARSAAVWSATVC